MKILFVNASPKGERSVTLQTARYISKRYPNACEYSVLHAGARIKALEKDFTEAENAINAADAIIFVYPVYTFIAPYQLHRFIELTKDSEVSCKGKYCAQILTSKHFYDVTAMKYVEANALDLGMRYLGALSADMEDLQSEEGRYEAECFFERFLFDVAKGNYTEAPSHAPQAARPVYGDYRRRKLTEYDRRFRQRLRIPGARRQRAQISVQGRLPRLFQLRYKR